MTFPEGESQITERQLVEDWFAKEYGVPLNWAVEMAQLNNECGNHWRGVFEHMSEEIEKSAIYQNESTTEKRRS
jgi:hypothetical protein